MRTLVLTALAGLLLAGCAAPAAQQAAAPSAETLASACSAKGGAIQPVGKAQIPTCVVPYADAGRAHRPPPGRNGRRCRSPPVRTSR